MTEPATRRTPGKEPRISTGVPGLDDVLCGGLTPSRLYLLEGTRALYDASGASSAAGEFRQTEARIIDTRGCPGHSPVKAVGWRHKQTLG